LPKITGKRLVKCTENTKNSEVFVDNYRCINYDYGANATNNKGEINFEKSIF